MATYYWVGGTGNWNSTQTAPWATSSGGAGGAGVPTSADNVIFDTLSNATAYAVNVGANAVCNDVTIAGPAAGNVTITMGATAVINCYGSWTNAATGVVFSTTSGATLNFLATSTGKTIGTNSVSLGSMAIVCNSATGGWTLSTGMLNPGSVTVTSTASAGFNTNGLACSFGSLLSTGSVARTISLGASAITLTGTATVVNFLAATNLTFNAGTSTITPSAVNPSLRGSGQTFYNVLFSSASAGTSTIQGSNTFNNLTQTSRSATGQRSVSVDGDNTITGTLTLQTLGTPVAMQRVFVQSSVIGTQRTLTAAALSGMADIDFRDIVGAGAASWTGTRIGNCLNNTGITFTAAADKYWSLAGGGNIIATAWALTAGGAPAVANFPLAQDRILIVDTGLNSGAALNLSQTTNWNLGELTFASRTLPVTITASTNVGMLLHKDLTLSSAVTWSSATGGAIQCVGQGTTQVITSAAVTVDQPFTVNSVTGTVQLNGNFTSALGTGLTHTSGGLDLNSFTLTALNYNTSSTIAHTLAFSTTGKMVLTGNNATVVSGSGGNLSVTGTAPLIQFTYSGGTGSRNIVMPPLVEAQAISVEFLNNATDAVAIQGVSGGYKDITFTSFSGSLTFANTTNIFGNLYVCSGVSGVAGSGTTFAGTTGTQTITTAGPSPITFESAMTKTGASTLQLQTAVALGTTRSFILTSGTLELNGFDLTTGLFSSTNSNVRTLNFGTNKLVLTGNAGTVFTIQTATNLTLLGTPQIEATYPGSTGNRTITPGANFASPEANAVNVRVTAGGDTVILSTTSSAYKNVEFTSGFTGTVQIANSFAVYGDWTFSPNMVTPTTSSGTVSFASTNATPRTITSNGKAFGASAVNFNGVGGTWQLQDNFAISSTTTINLTNGTLDLNNFSATSGLFNSNNSNTRAIAFGSSGKVVLNGVNTTVLSLSTATNFTYTGTSRIEITASGGTARTITPPATDAVESNALNIYVTTGSDTVTVGGAARFLNFDLTGFAGTLTYASSSRYFGDLVFSSGMALGSVAGRFVFSATSGTKTVTTAGLTFNTDIAFDGIGGTWAMQDALTLGSTRALTLTNGTLQLKSGTTNTVGSFVTPGLNQTYLQATTPGVQATISAPSGTYSATFITIQDSNATGGATWEASNAVNPVNAGNNTGWNFAFSLSGVAGTGSVGTVTSGVSPTALSGVQATGSVGTIYIGWRDINTTQTQTWTPVITS